MNEPTTESDDAATGVLPEPPTYELEYDEDDTAYQMAVDSGCYGVMYAGEYEWGPVRCTAEAYGEYDPNARPGNRRKTRDGKPRRSLKFHTGWLDVATAKECIREIPQYNRFDPERVASRVDAMPGGIKLAVAREGSPAIYVWTDEPTAVIDAIDGDYADMDVPPRRLDDDLVGCPPNEAGGVPNADTYPMLVVGEDRDTLTDGDPTLVRLWWD